MAPAPRLYFRVGERGDSLDSREDDRQRFDFHQFDLTAEQLADDLDAWGAIREVCPSQYFRIGYGFFSAAYERAFTVTAPAGTPLSDVFTALRAAIPDSGTATTSYSVGIEGGSYSLVARPTLPDSGVIDLWSFIEDGGGVGPVGRVESEWVLVPDRWTLWTLKAQPSSPATRPRTGNSC